jgi:uncharacterized protein
MDRLESRRILIFVATTFGFSWLLAALLALRGGLRADATTLLLMVLYMWGPTVGNLVARALTGEGRRALLLRPVLRREWPWWLAAWLLTPVLVLAGAIVFFVALPWQFDPEASAMRAQMAEAGRDAPTALLMVAILIGFVIVGPVLNVVGTFGEEFGWRGYLQPKLMPLGTANALLLTGVIWGVWHAPAIAMGHNYGVDHPGAPWAGIAMMTCFCVVAGVFMGWLTWRAGSVWPAVIAHGSVNAIGGTALLFTLDGMDRALLGPGPAGLLGASGFTLAALIILVHIRRST